MILVSACLAGIGCQYDGKDNTNKKVVELVKLGQAIPVCPEQLGGLPTPRTPSERRGDRIITQEGEDVTNQFKRGAREALQLAQLVNSKKAILKSNSPSCGCGQIYDGTFSGKYIKGDGIFTEILKENHVEVLSDLEITK